MALINFSGLASGIDSTALIKATSDAARKSQVEPNETKIQQLDDANTGLTELKTKFETLQEKLKLFSSLSGGGLSKTATSSNDAYVSATATNAANNGTYTVTTTQIAKNATFSWNTNYSSTSSVISGSAGNVTLNVGTGSNLSAVTVAVTATTTISEYVAAFNAATTKATASVVNIGTTVSPQYRVMVTSNKEGTSEGQIALSADVGTLTSGGNTLSAATDATFTVSGITGTITRSSNSVNDVIPGITFAIQGVGASTITITDDVSTTQGKVQDFVDSYNEIITYLAENNTITRDQSGTEVKNVYGSLANTRVDDNSLQTVRAAISAAVYSSGSTVKIFPDIGITTERDGTLKFDTDKFATAMSAEPNSVNNLLKTFADQTSVTGGTIDIITRFNGLLDTTLTSNKTQISTLTDRISEAEARILRQEEDIRARFSRLEAVIGKLQGQQSQLTSALAGLN